MKNKVILLAAVLTLTCSANAFAAFAWITTTTAGDSVIPVTGTRPALNIKPSANVSLGYDTIALGASYSVGTNHATGTFTYATTSTDTNIYRFLNTLQSSPQVGPDAPASATAQVAWGAGWTASK